MNIKATVISEDKPWEEIVEELKDLGIIEDSKLNMSKLLREDKSLNLELLELSVKYLVSVTKTIKVIGITQYFMERGVMSKDSQAAEELTFFLNLVLNLTEEFNESDEKVKVLWQTTEMDY